MADVKHTYTGRTGGAAVDAAEYPTVNSQAGIVGTAPTYADVGGDIHVASPTTAVQSMLRDFLSGSAKVLSMTERFRFAAAPSAAQEIYQGRAGTAGSNAKVGNLLAGVSSGNPTLLARGGGDVALTGWTTAAVLALNTEYEIRIQVEIGTTTSNGRMRAELWAVGGSSPIAAGEHTALNNGTAAGWWATQYLRPSASGTVGLLIDDVHVTDELPYGTYAAAAADAVPAPVVSAGDDQTAEPFSVVTLTGVATSGAVTTWSWAQTAGDTVTLSGSGASRTFTAPARLTAKTYTFAVTGTNAGGSSTDTVVVTVPPHLEWMRKSGVLVPMRNLTP